MALDVGRIFSRSLDVYQRNLKIAVPFFLEYVLDTAALTLAVFLAVLAMGASILSMGVDDPRLAVYRFLTAGTLSLKLLVFLAFLGLVLFAFFLVLRASARAATIGLARGGIEGRAAFAGGMEAARRHGLSVLAFLIVQAFMASGAILLAFLPAVLAGVVGAGSFAVTALAIFGTAAGFLAVLAVFFFTLFAPQIIVLHGRGAVSAIRESAEFVYSHLWDVVLYGLLAFGLSVVVFLILPNVFMPVIAFSDSAFLKASLEILQGLLSLLGTILLNAYLETVKTALVMEAALRKTL
ncbi:MAG: hypothetical protein GXO65_04710 [Euryarchaeota archaeon]|nr:hypothetical protein [Euryarchaeota archaeon]